MPGTTWTEDFISILPAITISQATMSRTTNVELISFPAITISRATMPTRTITTASLYLLTTTRFITTFSTTQIMFG
jgi:hypothetical protein